MLPRCATAACGQRPHAAGPWRRRWRWRGGSHPLSGHRGSGVWRIRGPKTSRSRPAVSLAFGIGRGPTFSPRRNERPSPAGQPDSLVGANGDVVPAHCPFGPRGPPGRPHAWIGPAFPAIRRERRRFPWMNEAPSGACQCRNGQTAKARPMARPGLWFPRGMIRRSGKALARSASRGQSQPGRRWRQSSRGRPRLSRCRECSGPSCDRPPTSRRRRDPFR
jgi:hypothetical protein